MKKSKLALMIGLGGLISITSCKKDALIPEENSSISTTEKKEERNQAYSIVAFDQAEYEDYIQRASTFFYPKSASNEGKAIKVNNEFRPTTAQMDQLRKQADQQPFETAYIESRVVQFKSYKDQFPNVTGTALDFYINALTGNKDEWGVIAAQYPDLFHMGETGVLMLMHTDLVSSMINLDGAYTVAGELIRYEGNAVKVYTSDNYEVSSTKLTCKTPKTVKVNGQQTGARGYSLKYNQYHNFFSTLRMLLQGYEDFVFLDGCAGWRVYGQTRVYPQFINNGQWVTLLCNTIISVSEWPSKPSVNSATHTNSTWGSAGGTLGCSNSSSQSLLSHGYFLVAPGWAWLGASSTYY